MSSQVSRKLIVADTVASLMYEITRAWDARMEAAVATLREPAGFEISVRQALALWSLHQPLAMTDLARFLACDQSNVTGIVDRLERHGLVRRDADDRDRRVKRVALTPSGKRLRRRLEGALDAKPALNELTMVELESLQALLERALAVSRANPAANRPSG